MRSEFIDYLTETEDDRLLTTGEAAKILGTSRQHIVDLTDRGDLPYTMVGSHRRIRRADLAKETVRARPRTRDQIRSLWLGYGIAGQLVEHPDGLLDDARHLLAESAHDRRNKWNEEWSRLLEGSLEGVLEALTSNSIRSQELRQNNPFTTALGESRRSAILSEFGKRHPGGSI